MYGCCCISSLLLLLYLKVEIDVPSFVAFMCSPFDWYSIFAAAALDNVEAAAEL